MVNRALSLYVVGGEIKCIMCIFHVIWCANFLLISHEYLQTALQTDKFFHHGSAMNSLVLILRGVY